MKTIEEWVRAAYMDALTANDIPHKLANRTPAQAQQASLLFWATLVPVTAAGTLSQDAIENLMQQPASAPAPARAPAGAAADAEAPAPIPFAVTPALRSGSFQTAVMNYPGGYSTLEWRLTGMGSGPGSDYENAANAFSATVYFSVDGGATYNEFTNAGWAGTPGGAVIKGVTDPPPDIVIGLGNLPAGAKVYLDVVLTGTFTIGIGNGLIS